MPNNWRARIRGYWGVENKVHYVRDVTQGEDNSRVRTTPLVQIFALVHGGVNNPRLRFMQISRLRLIILV